MKFQRDYFGASLAHRPVPSASDHGAPDASDQLHVASGARSPPLAIPELLTRLLQKKKKKNLFLSGSIQAAIPELNPGLLQSVRYQILQKVEYRKKCVTETENLHCSGRGRDYFALKLNRITGGTLCQTRRSTTPVLVPLLQAGSAPGPRCEGAPTYVGTVRWRFSGL